MRGRCLLAGGAATAGCALVLDERDLLRVGAFVALLPLLALLLAARTRRAVRARRRLGPDRAPVGVGVTVEVGLDGGPLIGALRLADAVPDAVGADRSRPPRFTVHRLTGSGTVLTYTLIPTQRGVHRVGPLTARATDPLGLAEFDRELVAPSTLVTLPRVVALRGQPPALGAGEGNPGAAPAHQGQGRYDVLVRPYRLGDELRRVHWRSTARQDELMVRLEEHPWRSETTVLLDRRDEAHRGHGPSASLEFAVSLAASIGAHLIARGEPVTVVTEDGTELGSAAGGTDAMLDAMAALRPAARTELSGPALGAGDLVAVLGSVGPGKLDTLLARRPSGGHAVLLDVATWEQSRTRDADAATNAATLRRAGWRVAVAGANTTPDRAWDDLVRGSTP